MSTGAATADTVQFKDRLLYLLQPPLDSVFDGRQLEVPFKLFDYLASGRPIVFSGNSANNPVTEAGAGLAVSRL